MDENDEDNDYDKNNFHNNDSYSYSFLLLRSHSKIALNKVNRVEWHLTVVCFPPIALLGNSNCVSFEGNMESKVLIWTSGALRSSRSSQTWTPLLVVMLPAETCCKWVLSPNPSQIYWCCTEKDRQVYIKCFMHWLYTLDWIVCLLILLKQLYFYHKVALQAVSVISSHLSVMIWWSQSKGEESWRPYQKICLLIQL